MLGGIGLSCGLSLGLLDVFAVDDFGFGGFVVGLGILLLEEGGILLFVGSLEGMEEGGRGLGTLFGSLEGDVGGRRVIFVGALGARGFAGRS